MKHYRRHALSNLTACGALLLGVNETTSCFDDIECRACRGFLALEEVKPKKIRIMIDADVVNLDLMDVNNLVALALGGSDFNTNVTIKRLEIEED